MTVTFAKLPQVSVLYALVRFQRKPIQDKILSIRFRVRRILASIPFLPVPYRLRVGNRNHWFIWSHILPAFEPDAGFLEYVGDDTQGLSFLVRFLKPGMNFVDIGSYRGLYSVMASRLVTGSGLVTAFEPSIRDRRWLRFHVLLNRLKNCRIEPYAVGERTGRTSFFVVVSGYTTMNSLRRPATKDPTAEVKVKMTTLDNYFETNGDGRIDLLKVDTEGGEIEVFRGAQATLTRWRPVILCEVLDWVHRPWGRGAVAVIDYLADLDYEWFDLREDGRISPHARQADYPEIKNYLAVPREKAGLIEGLKA